MGDTVAKPANVYECIGELARNIDHAVYAADALADMIEDDLLCMILTALCGDAVSLGARLTVFALQNKEQLECISIDQ